MVLPYISIVAEKTEHLSCVLAPLGCAGVKGFFGNEEGGAALGPRGETVAVCTIEKANVAVNRLAQEGRLGAAGRPRRRGQAAAPPCTLPAQRRTQSMDFIIKGRRTRCSCSLSCVQGSCAAS